MTDEKLHLRSDEHCWGWRSTLAKQHPSPSWTLFNISCLVYNNQPQRPLWTLCLPRTSAPPIRRLDIVTTHSFYSTSLSLSLAVSLLLSHSSLTLGDICCATLAQGWNRIGRGKKSTLFWVTALHAGCHTNSVHSFGFPNSPHLATQLDSSRSVVLPASH